MTDNLTDATPSNLGQRSNATAIPAGHTRTPDGCIVPSQTGTLATCTHGRDVPDHVTARQGKAGHQRTR